MRRVTSGRFSVVSSAWLGGFCILITTASLLASCSIPNLEETECREARDPVREYYSFHFGNGMKTSEGRGQLREKYFTDRLRSELRNDDYTLAGTTTDYFTDSSMGDLPKAFRAGACSVVEPGEKVKFDVLLFWKDDTRTEQKHVFASLKKENGSWLIDSVSPLDND